MISRPSSTGCEYGLLNTEDLEIDTDRRQPHFSSQGPLRRAASTGCEQISTEDLEMDTDYPGTLAHPSSFSDDLKVLYSLV
jgi:hypothetical protein